MALVLGVLFLAMAGCAAYVMVEGAGPPYLDSADVEGVWTEEGGDGRLTLREDSTAELTGTAVNGGPDGPPLRGTWRVGIPDEPRTVELDFPYSVGLDVDESGGRATLSIAVHTYDTPSFTRYVRGPG
ncbi:hypothetical protein AB0M64_15110 [Streptomyces sp. NPDC051771]|uniref:hypothetical protein n=1 Tax=Streptomyces sp. NPDC051771 TaxID=3154847 RepID=UPI003425F4F3